MKTNERLPRATHYGVLRIGEAEMDAFVLEDGRRVLSRRGMAKAFGFSEKSTGANFAKFAESSGVKPYLSGPLEVVLKAPIRFAYRGEAHGFEATMLQDLCVAVIRAGLDGRLHHTQHHLAQHAASLMTGFAKIGIVALVDEATGYQKTRRENELRALCELYIAEELRPWSPRFPSVFFEEMCRLRGWRLGPSRETPRYAGKLVNWLIYERLPVVVREELARINPADDNGRRRARHHQWIADGDAQSHLERLILQATTLMKASATWGEFERAWTRLHGPPAAPIPDIDPRQLGLFELLGGGQA